MAISSSLIGELGPAGGIVNAAFYNKYERETMNKNGVVLRWTHKDGAFVGDDYVSRSIASDKLDQFTVRKSGLYLFDMYYPWGNFTANNDREFDLMVNGKIGRTWGDVKPTEDRWLTFDSINAIIPFKKGDVLRIIGRSREPHGMTGFDNRDNSPGTVSFVCLAGI